MSDEWKCKECGEHTKCPACGYCVSCYVIKEDRKDTQYAYFIPSFIRNRLTPEELALWEQESLEEEETDARISALAKLTDYERQLLGV
jgi:hypothetical protein